MSWLDELDKELDDAIKCREQMDRYTRTIRELQEELDNLYATNADNVRKAHRVFRMLYQVEQTVMKCPMCGANRDDDGILAHSMKCDLADTLENANDF